jgi:ABC-2 type transport system ATP-binding protein
VFLNSHLLSEVEVTCDRVAFIRRGEIVRSGSLQEVADSALVGNGLSVHVRAQPKAGWESAANGHWDAVVAGLNQWASHVRADGDEIWLTLPDEAELPAITRYLVAHDVDVYALSPQRMSLEDLFMQLVDEEEAR